MTRTRPPFGAVLLIVVALLAPAAFALLSGGEAGAAGTVRVVLRDGAIEAPATARAGRVSFDVANRGTTEHELLVVRTDLPADDLPMGLEGPSVKLAGRLVLGRPHTHSHGDGVGGGRHLRPGGSRVTAVSLRPGRYVLLCNLPGHYQAGQRASLTVR